MSAKKIKKSSSINGLAATPERAGRYNAKAGIWEGRPQELADDTIILDKSRPKDFTTVHRIQDGVRTLHKSGKIGDREATAADRWYRDYSLGTGVPLRASDMRFLGVSLGGASSAAGVLDSTLDAATRLRNAISAVGQASAHRLDLFVAQGRSLNAMASLCALSRQDLGGALVSDLQRLGEHYHDVDSRRTRKPAEIGPALAVRASTGRGLSA